MPEMGCQSVTWRGEARHTARSDTRTDHHTIRDVRSRTRAWRRNCCLGAAGPTRVEIRQSQFGTVRAAGDLNDAGPRNSLMSVCNSDLWALVRHKLAADALPSNLPERTDTNHGDDQPCAVCDRHVSRREVEHEFESTPHGTLRFHHDCFIAWWRAVAGARRV